MKKYRDNVALVVMNKDKKILVCKRIGKLKAFAWQLPQGGIDEGESVEDAVYRELYEETSIKSAKIVHILDKPIIYYFPDKIREKLKKKNKGTVFFGQNQYWTLLYFFGADSEINLKTKEPEFTSYKWETMDFAINNIIEFKKNSYIKAFNLIKPIIENYEPK